MYAARTRSPIPLALRVVCLSAVQRSVSRAKPRSLRHEANQFAWDVGHGWVGDQHGAFHRGPARLFYGMSFCP